MSKKIKDLKAEDFPGIDPVKFDEWQAAKVSSNRNQIIGVLIILAIMLLAQFKILHFGGVEWLLCVVAIVIINIVTTSKFRKLTKELNLTNLTIREALKKP
jgi:hypothetical protein